MKSPADEDEELVVVAHAVKTKGLKGELVAEILTDFPERFAKTAELVGIKAGKETKQLRLESHSFQKDRVVLKFAGYDDIESAQDLVGFDFAVPQAECVPLAEDEFYEWQLEGCTVENLTGTKVGQVTRLMQTGGVQLIVVEGEARREYLIPMTHSIVKSIETSRKKIVIDPPEGLLDL